MRKQKYISFMLAVVLLLSALPLNYIFAHEGYGDNKWVEFAFGEGDFQFVEFTTEATGGTGTTFKTIGWNLKFRRNSGESWREVHVPVEIDDGLELKYKLYLSEKGYEKNVPDNSNERVKHSIEYYVSSSDMAVYRDVQYNGGIWQLNASIQLYINNKAQPGKVANTFDQALTLASWSYTTRNELHTDYYERPGTSDPEPIVRPNFDILYKGSKVNGKTVEKDMDDLRIILLDKTTGQSTANPIEERTWYYWNDNISGGWDLIPETGDNDTEVTIPDCDSDLIGSKPLIKAFRLDVKDSYGMDYSVFGKNYEVTFKIPNGIINVHYTNTETGDSVYPDSIINDVPFNVQQTINPKAAPAGMTLLNPTPQKVTLTSSNPIADIYFLYAPDTEGCIITVYYKDKATKQDISQPDVITGDYGTYEIEALDISGYTLDSSTPSPVTVTTSESNRTPTVTFFYIAPKPSLGPHAIINIPSKERVGDEFIISGTKSYDPDGKIVSYEWNIGDGELGYGVTTLVDKPSAKIWYSLDGYHTITLTVTDNEGNRDSASDKIQIVPPNLEPLITVTGRLKENRKITMSAAATDKPLHFKFVNDEIAWTLEPSAGGTIENIKYHGELVGITKDILSKKPLTLKIKNSTTIELKDGWYLQSLVDAGLYSEIPRYSAETEKTIVIAPDLLPVADFYTPTTIMRNPEEENYGTFDIELEKDDTYYTYSPDDDPINKTVLMFAYDSDNDGDFKKETWYYSKDGSTWQPIGLPYDQIVSSFNIYNIATGYIPKFTLKSKEVGMYRFALRVMEDIPAEETIPEFITENDYRRNATFE